MRAVRRIFAMELVFVMACLGTAHALLNLDWLRTALLAPPSSSPAPSSRSQAVLLRWRRGWWDGDTKRRKI